MKTRKLKMSLKCNPNSFDVDHDYSVENITVKQTFLANGSELVFVPVRNVPGFGHRVVIDGTPAGWLDATHYPSKENAAYFFAKHFNGSK